MASRQLKKAESGVDYVILEEVTEVVKFEAMNLVDRMLLVNSQEKKDQLEKVKKHKHVVFAEQPTIIEYTKRKVTTQHTSGDHNQRNHEDEEKVSDDAPSNNAVVSTTSKTSKHGGKSKTTLIETTTTHMHSSQADL